jgi:hypothetical protein
MDSKNIQIGLINVVIGGALIWLLIAQRSLVSLENLFFWLATGTFIIHWYWGLIAYVRYAGPTEDLAEFFLDMVAVSAQVSTIFWIGFPFFWFILNGFSFLMAIAKYVLTLRTRKLSPQVTDYIKDKLKLHAGGVVGMAAGAVAAMYFQPLWILGLAALLAHLLALSYLIAKKVYVLSD